MMRFVALSMGAVVAIATVFNSANALATSGHSNQEKSKSSVSKQIEMFLDKYEDGHKLTQKWLKVKDDKKTSRFHLNVVKDTDEDEYNSLTKKERHYHSNTVNVEVDDDGNEITTRKVVVYNVNKNKTICNIVKHVKNGEATNEDCSWEKDDDSTPVVPNDPGDDEPVVDLPEPQQEPEEDDSTVVIEEDEQEPVAVEAKGSSDSSPTPEEETKEVGTPESLPVTGAEPISGTLMALAAALVTFIGYASALAFMEVRLKNKF